MPLGSDTAMPPVPSARNVTPVRRIRPGTAVTVPSTATRLPMLAERAAAMDTTGVTRGVAVGRGVGVGRGVAPGVGCGRRVAVAVGVGDGDGDGVRCGSVLTRGVAVAWGVATGDGEGVADGIGRSMMSAEVRGQTR